MTLKLSFCGLTVAPWYLERLVPHFWAQRASNSTKRIFSYWKPHELAVLNTLAVAPLLKGIFSFNHLLTYLVNLFNLKYSLIYMECKLVR